MANAYGASGHTGLVAVERRCVGQWWLPDKPEQKVGGVLEIDTSGGSKLELTDSLVSTGGQAKPVPLLLGTADGRYITLIDSMPANGGKTVIAQAITITQVVRPAVVVVGVHLEAPDESIFDGMETAISGLTAWAAHSGLDFERLGGAGGNERGRLTVSWTDPVEVELTEPPAKLGLHWTLSSSGPDLGPAYRQYRAEEAVKLRVEASAPRAWKGFLDEAVAVRDLLTVATQAPARITGRTLLIKQDGLMPFYHVDLYFKGSGTDRDSDEIDESAIVFTLNDVAFTDVIPKWFALRKTLGLPLDVLLGLDYQGGGYYENRLFNAASAAEGFHTALFPDATGLAPEVYEAVRKQVEAALSDTEKAARDWVLNRLGDNRPGLKDRLLELTTRADPDAVTTLLTDVDTWAKWLKNARNAIGHLNTGELKKKIPNEDARYRLEYVTRALLHLIIVAELGISAERQREVVDLNWGYSAGEFGNAVKAAVSL